MSSILRAVAVCLVLAEAGCGGGDRKTAAVPHSVASWEEFTEGPAASNAGRRQVVFVGLDAGVWHVIDRLIDDGKLPNFARIKREGATGPLRSVDPYVTPPAWTSMFTGYLPQKTGVYSFGYWDEDSHEFISANSDDIEVPAVWDAATRAGLRTGVFNVPMTFPPHPVGGAMVTGQMTPIEMFDPPSPRPAFELADRWAAHFPRPQNSYAPPAVGVIVDSLNVFLATIYDGTRDGVQRHDSVAVRVFPRSADPAGAVEPIGGGTGALGEFGPWLRCLFRRESGEAGDAYVRVKVTLKDRQTLTELSPVVLPIDATFTYPADLAKTLDDRFGFYLPTKFMPREVVGAVTRDMTQYASYFYDYDDWDLYCFVFTQTDNVQHVAGYSHTTDDVYEQIDRFVGALMSRMPANAVLVVASDHGSSEHEWGIDMNMLLSQLHLLVFESPGHIDYDRTVVFHNLGYLYFNDALLTREALAARGHDVPAGTNVRQWLVDHLRRTTVRLPEGGRSFEVDAEPLPGDAVGHAPDMVIVGDYPDYTVEFWNIMNPSTTVVRRLKGNDKYWHCRNGVFMLWGEGVRKGVDAGTRNIQDVGPTMLYLLGLPVAPDMDGEVMRDLFEPALTSKLPVIVNEGYRDIPREVVLPGTERESLQKKLRSLGYIQ